MGMIINTPGVSKVLSGIQESMRMKKPWPVILTKFSKTDMLHVVLDWQKINKTVLEKAFFFKFLAFLSFLVLVSKNL
jgi:hypothetical protein